MNAAVAMKEAEKMGLYGQLGDLLCFPGEDIYEKTQECINALLELDSYPREAVEEVEAFLKDIKGLTLDNLQGVFSYTFEFASDYSLDLGYHLYEGFKRSNYLVSLKVMYKSNGFPYDDIAKGELPDSLPVVLKYVDFEKNEVLKKDLRESLLVKGLEVLNKNFERNEKAEYRHLLKAILIVVDADVKAGSLDEDEPV